MHFGNIKTTYPIDDSGSHIITIDTYWRARVTKVLKQYRIRVKVYNPQEEMTEYIRFTEEIAKHRANGTLAYDKEDGNTRPAFIIEYPKENIDGGYFVIKSYTVQS